MKTQILHLDPHDDHASARDLLAWVQAPRVLLVWPAEGRVLTRRLDLVLLAREAERRGARLGLVTHDPAVRLHAQELGLPVFDGLDRVPDRGWISRPRGRKPRPPAREERPPLPAPPPRARPLPAALRYALVALALLAWGSLAAFLLPSAEIVLAPRTRRIDARLTVVLDPQVEQTTPDGRLPAREVETTVAGSLRAPTSGRVAVPGETSRGRLRVVNLGDAPLTLPAGTGVRSSQRPEVRFLTEEDLELPAGPGVSAEVAIMAEAPGPQGNLPAGTLDSIEGPLGLSIEVDNPEPTRGGTNISHPGVSKGDRIALRQALLDQLLTEAAASLQADLEPGEELAHPSLRVVEVLSEEYDAEVGEARTSLSLEMEVVVQGLAYPQADLERLAQQRLAAEVPRGWEPLSNSMQLRIEETADNSRQLALTATMTIMQAVDRAAVSRSLAGLEPTAVSPRLRSVGAPALETLSLAPSWLPRLPLLPQRIAVRMAPEVR